MTDEHLATLKKMARRQDDLAPAWSEAAEAALDEIVTIRRWMADADVRAAQQAEVISGLMASLGKETAQAAALRAALRSHARIGKRCAGCGREKGDCHDGDCPLADLMGEPKQEVPS